MKKLFVFLTAALCFTLSAVQVFAAPLTEAEALALAQEAVPAKSEHLRTELDGAWYEVEFFSDARQEYYEVNVEKALGKISLFESKAVNARGGETVSLSEEQAKKVLLDENEGAKVLSSVVERDDGLSKYVLSFSSETYYGEYHIHTQSGKVLEREIKTGTAPAKETADGFLSIEKAVELAKKQVPDATVSDVDLEKDNGRYCYKIELQKDGTEYDITLDAKTGALLWSGSHTDDERPAAESGSAYIGEEKAKQIVLAKLPNAKIIQCEFDTDDGRAVYEGEAIDGNYEYEFTIDARTGDILEWDKDNND